MNHFLSDLQQYSESNMVANPYKSDILLRNLELYLTRLKKQRVNTILVGEAPGYKGCAKTGIPFTSEFIMMNYNNEVLGQRYGYRRLDHQAKLQKENTATIIWNEIGQYGQLPLLWNIFPFHPYKQNNVNTNRAPRNSELKDGMEFVKMLLSMFPEISTVIAVGNRAHAGLTQNKIECIKTRHPSFGGKTEFCACVSQYLKR